MDQLKNKLSQWFTEEQEILDQLAHDVAMSDGVEDMMEAKKHYTDQEVKINVIQEVLRFVEEEMEQN